MHEDDDDDDGAVLLSRHCRGLPVLRLIGLRRELG